MVTELAVDVAPFAQRLHLVDSDALSSSACSSRVSTSSTGSPLAFGITMSAPGSMWASTASGDVGFEETLVCVIAEPSPSAVAFDEPVDHTLADDAL